MALLRSGTRIYGNAVVDTFLTISGTNAATTSTSGALIVSGGAGIAGNVYVGGNLVVDKDVSANNAVFTGNLIINGNIVYSNVDTMNIKDPLIEQGGNPNGTALTNNDAKDRGQLLHYFTTKAVDAFMGWDNSNAEFAFGSNVTTDNNVVTFNQYGNIRAGFFVGDGGALSNINPANINGIVGNASHANVADSANSVSGGNVTSQVANALIAETVTASSQPNISSFGTLSGLSVAGQTSLGPVANVHITGGTSGYVLSTDGAGNLSWTAQTGGGGSQSVLPDVAVDKFTADGSTNAFQLSVTPSSKSFVMINIDGVMQLHDSYDLFGNSVSFGSTPVVDSVIEISTFVQGSISGSSVDLTSVAGNIIPSANITYNLGSPSKRWKDLYLSGSTIDLAGATIKTDAATGAIALVPKPTDSQPNPTGVVITATGMLTTIATTSGLANSQQFANAIANSPNYASVTYVDDAIGNLVNTAPAALDTLNELATALGNDASFSTTVTNTLANKLNSNAFTYANITGKPTLGNLSAINIDGNSSNILYGNGAFAAVPTQGVTLNAYATSSSFPSSNNGAMALALDTAVLYIRNSNAWVAVKSANPQYITLNQPGTITTPVTGTARYYPKGNITIGNVYAYLGTPSSSNLTFNIYKNGSNVGLFTVNANSYVMTMANTNISLTTSDYLTLGVATGTGATDLKVDLGYL